jgi:integrase
VGRTSDVLSIYLWGGFHTHDEEPGVCSTLHCGLREGELLELRWDEVDLSGDTATLQVRRTLSETRTGHKFEKP